MQLSRIARSQQFRGKRLISVGAVLVTLALAACGGSSKTPTSTTASSASTSQPTTAATSATSGGATATTTTAATATEAATTAATATTEATEIATAVTTATEIATEVATATQAASGGGSGSGSAIMLQVADAWKNVKSYKMTITFYDSGSTTPTGTATVENENPDKSHWVIDSSGQKIETITIGTDSYLNLGGTWTKSPSVDTTDIPGMSSQDIANELSTPIPDDTKFSSKGSDTVNGVDCNVYEITETDGTVSTFYVGKKDHLLYKIEASGSDGTKTEILISDYNADFNITAPI
ncbi:MAG: hypothetical protein WBW04_00005 [Nitrolancea sp.]